MTTHEYPVGATPPLGSPRAAVPHPYPGAPSQPWLPSQPETSPEPGQRPEPESSSQGPEPEQKAKLRAAPAVTATWTCSAP